MNSQSAAPDCLECVEEDTAPWDGGDVTREEINVVLSNLCGLHFGFESGLIGYTDSEKFYLDAEDCRRYGEAFTAAARLMSPQPATMSREEGIAICATAGCDANGCRAERSDHVHFAARAAGWVLDEQAHVESQDFCDAVISTARRLVSSGECPALADCEAMR